MLRAFFDHFSIKSFCNTQSKFLLQPNLLAFSLLLSLCGCQVVKVESQTFAVSLTNERESILTRERLSEASLSVLSMTGQNPELCVNDPYTCLKHLKQVALVSDEQFLSTGSELLIAKLNSVKKTQHCISPLDAAPFQTEMNGLGNKIIRPVYSEVVVDLKPYYLCIAEQQKLLADTIRYAYAYLFFSSRDPKTRLFDNRQVQIRDFYNQATTNLIEIINRNNKESYAIDIPKDLDHGRFHFIHYLNNSFINPVNKKENIPISSDFVAASALNFLGLRSINRRDGFGADFVAILPEEAENPETNIDSYQLNRETLSQNTKNQSNHNIHPARYLPVTITAIPRGNTVDDILSSQNIDFKVYNPYDFGSTRINGTEYPLAANFSAPYGLWLARTDLAAAAYLGLLARENRLVAPHLYMLEPYNPNKRVIIMVHGLASSPEAWIGLTHDVLGDPELRDHYQVWQVFYSTNMPILESRYQIHALINNAFEKVDPQRQNQASRDDVLIGHSMGGVISRLLMSRDDLRPNALSYLESKNRRALLDLPMVQQRFIMQPLPEIGRMVLISAPLRGTEYADLWFTRAIRKIIRLPQSFSTGLINGIKEANLDQKVIETLHKITLANIQNGPSDLSEKSDFMNLTRDAKMIDGLPYHTIMGNAKGDIVLDKTSDGIVPYSSSHLDGAQSEKIITGGHSIQETPEAVLELRRILRLHLKENGNLKK
jgi:pimeloyl-ACP methyl ester carboxylesterase